MADQPSIVIPALQEEPFVRLAYLQAVMANVFGHLPLDRATKQLNGTLDCLRLAGCLPLIPRPVRTVASAKRRLGIDPDLWIIKYALCPKCWKHHTPAELIRLISDECTVPGCDGIIYDTIRGKRVARLINPQVSIIESLRRMFMRPGFAKKVEKKPEHQAGRNADEDFVMKDMHDGDAWYSNTTGTSREIGNRGTVRDVPTDGLQAIKLSSHRFGLQLTINMDGFGIIGGRPHSCHASYISVNNLAREERYLQVNVICNNTMPGPHEPTQQQLNHSMEPAAKEIMLLNHGVEMEIHGEEPDDIYADCSCSNCDTPAARKMNGTAGHSHDMHPCPYCNVNIVDVNNPLLMLYEGWQDKDDYTMLRHAFASRVAGAARQFVILRDFGVRWATFNLIPGWLPSSKTALDFMHNIFLGLICHIFMEILFKAYMFSGAGGAHSEQQRFEKIVNAIKWPSHITRLPKNLGTNQSLKKADEWRRLLTVTPVILWFTWSRGHGDAIPPGAPPIPQGATRNPSHSREYRKIYSAILLLCAGVRILASRQISMAQARVGQDFLSQYCRSLKLLGISTTINHHLAMHYLKFIKLFGPIYAWWLFAFERFNGMLEKVKHNGHDGGRMELTLLRNWVMCHLIYEYLLALPETDDPTERNYIDHIIRKEAREERGGMMTELAIYRSEASADNVSLPRRMPKYISLLLSIKLEGKPVHVCAIVQRLYSDDDIPAFPWEPFASTLGIHVSYAERFHPHEMIPVSIIEGPLALVPIHSERIHQDLWVSISFDHVCTSSQAQHDRY
ncbi:hypothetical protein PLICRDRAFT_115269 [Plicaturopsis crispa FD-325 SS-3]|nr:hypothetical protein PLICRDRAFT_115269 [Plicaturopsis crispa FD-325 SS-3]